MKVLDLFSGIGGFSLGLERAGMKTVAFCEIDPFCRKVLKKHWPEVPCYEDVRTLTAERLRADGIAPEVICGGFPCQDISLAGNRAGLAGDRSGLWRHYARLVRELRPKFVIVENTPGLLSLGMGDVLGDLASCGYDAEWQSVPASAIGAPHVRDRVWIVANPADDTRFYKPHYREAAQRLFDHSFARSASVGDAPNPAVCRMDDGIPDRVDRTSALGNAVVPQIPEIIGRAIMRAAA